MKQKMYLFMYIIAGFLFGTLYTFLCDLAYFSRIAKYESIWINTYSHMNGNQQQVWMANNDIFCIFIVLGLLMWIGYVLAPIYREKVFFIPLLGVPVFFIMQFMLCSVLKIICL